MDLNRPQLRTQWEGELGRMRKRIREMRVLLHSKLKALVPGGNYDFVTAQGGMFSYTGLSKPAVDRLRNEYSVYAVDSGRICVAAPNSRNINYIAEALSTAS